MSVQSSKKLLLASALVLAFATAGVPSEAKDVVIHAGTLVDGTMKPIRHQVSILVTDDRIIDIREGFIAAPGAEIIDLSKSFVLPGLIESHDHLGSDRDVDNTRGRVSTAGDSYIDVVRNAYSEIDQGFTSTRDCGTNGVDFRAIEYAIEKNRIVGPRIWASLEAMGPVGGHSDPWNHGATSEDATARDRSLIRGPVDAQEQVRDHFFRGAQVIKIMPSGGVGSLNDNPHLTTMTYEEMKAVADTAHALGLKVAAHAHGLEAINTAVRAGIDSIEHGTFADLAALKAMKVHGTFFDPSLVASAQHLEAVGAHPETFDPRVLKKGMEAWPLGIPSTREAVKLGLKIVMGTDQSSLGEGWLKARGITLLVEAGMSPQQAINAATGVAAELLGSPDVGILEKGRYADIIAVDKNPLSDTNELQHVQFVMKGGHVFKRDGKMLPRL